MANKVAKPFRPIKELHMEAYNSPKELWLYPKDFIKLVLESEDRTVFIFDTKRNYLIKWFDFVVLCDLQYSKLQFFPSFIQFFEYIAGMDDDIKNLYTDYIENAKQYK